VLPNVSGTVANTAELHEDFSRIATVTDVTIVLTAVPTLPQWALIALTVPRPGRRRGAAPADAIDLPGHPRAITPRGPSRPVRPFSVGRCGCRKGASVLGAVESRVVSFYFSPRA
jgi:hypothetical protein